MQPSILASIFYLISLFALLSGFFLIKKSENKLYFITWMPLSAVAIMCYQTLVAALLDLVHLSVNIISVGILDLLLGAVCWYIILRTKERQQYMCEWMDIVFVLILFGAMVLFTVLRYGTELSLHYNSVDGSAHMLAAMSMVCGESVDAMYFSALHNGILIELLAPLFSAGTYYKIYVLGDVLHLCLGGLMFWGVIRRYSTDSFMKIAGIIVSFLYLFGYPLNSTLFGFSYLGMSLTVILYVVAAADEIFCENISEWFGLLLLAFGCLGIFESYVMFVPVIFFGILIWMLIRQYRNGKLFSLNTVCKGLAVFLIPTAIGLWFTYRGIFGADTGVTVTSQINLEGGIYRNLFTDFVIPLPFAIGGMWRVIKEKKNGLLLSFVALEVVFTAALFLLVWNDKASGYYYYKNYFVLWILALILAYIGLGWLEKHARFMVTAGFAVWCMLAFMLVFHIDDSIQNKKPLLYGSAQIPPFMEIYSFNYNFMFSPIYDENKLDLYTYIRDDMIDCGMTDEVDMVGNWEDCLWLRAVTNTWIEIYDGSTIETIVVDGETDYIVVLYGSEEYNMAQELYDSLERVYENPAGYIAYVNQ